MSISVPYFGTGFCLCCWLRLRTATAQTLKLFDFRPALQIAKSLFLRAWLSKGVEKAKLHSATHSAQTRAAGLSMLRNLKSYIPNPNVRHMFRPQTAQELVFSGHWFFFKTPKAQSTGVSAKTCVVLHMMLPTNDLMSPSLKLGIRSFCAASPCMLIKSFGARKQPRP